MTTISMKDEGDTVEESHLETAHQILKDNPHQAIVAIGHAMVAIAERLEAILEILDIRLTEAHSTAPHP